MRRVSVVLAALAALLLGAAYASAVAGAYDGAYQGTLSYTADVPGTGTVSGSAPLSLSVAGGGVSGSFTVPYYGTISFSGTASSSGSATATAPYGCVLSMRFTVSGSSANVSGSISGCSDQGGSASGSFTATRVSAPPTTTSGSTPSEPGTESTRVLNESGNPVVEHPDGSTEPLSGAVILHPGDLVKTDSGSRVDLLLASADVIRIGPNSTFELITLHKDAVTYGEKLGQILYDLKCAIHNCKVITTNAVVAVRGTKFSVDTRAGLTHLRVFKHTVDFSNPKAPGKHVLVKAGFASTITGSRAPTKPKRF